MSRKRIETRSYKQPITLRTLRKCGFKARVERYAAEVDAACTLWLAKRQLEGLAAHPWRNNW